MRLKRFSLNGALVLFVSAAASWAQTTRSHGGGADPSALKWSKTWRDHSNRHELTSGRANEAALRGDLDVSDPGDAGGATVAVTSPADGSVVVGFAGSGHEGVDAFRCTQDGGMIGLGDLPGGVFISRAEDVSADGSVVVGQGLSASGEEAFRWTHGSGIVGLGDLPGGEFDSTATGVSADGSVVVGEGTSALGSEASIWDEANGLRNLRGVLESDLGLDLTGWRSKSQFRAQGRGGRLRRLPQRLWPRGVGCAKSSNARQCSQWRS